jgi:hypothetical protein
MRSITGRPSAANMYGMKTASKERIQVSMAVIWPLIQSRRIELTATWPCRSAACS